MRYTYVALKNAYTTLKNARQEHGAVVALRLALGLAFSRAFVFSLLKGAVSSAWVLILTALSVCWGIEFYEFLDSAADTAILQYGEFALSRNTFLLYGSVFPVALFLWAIRASDKMARQPKPEPSGAHGTAEIATPAMIAAAGLTGGKWGEGVRLCEDGAGNIIRYTGKKPGKKTGQPNGIAIIGPPRCGKQATLLTALTVENQGSMVIFDPKGELTATTLHARKQLGPVKIICPIRDRLAPSVRKIISAHFEAEGTPGQTTDSFNILDGIEVGSDAFELLCADVSGMLIKSDGETQGGGFFSGTARNAVTGVIAHLLEHYRRRATLAEVCDIVSTERLFAMSQDVMDNGSRYVQRFLERFSLEDAKTDKQVRDFQSTARQQLDFISSRAMERAFARPEKPWDFLDLKNGEKPTTVFVVIPVGLRDVMAKFNRLLITSVVNVLLSDTPGRNHVTILADEFRTLGRVDQLLDVFSIGGGAGVSMIPVTQNVSQMLRIWGADWETIKEGCDLHIYFPPKTDKETIAEISRFAGTKTIVTKSFSYDPNTGEGKGVNYNEKGQPVLDPHEIPAMMGNCIINAPGIVKHVIVGTTKFYRDYPDIDALCNENPWQA